MTSVSVSATVEEWLGLRLSSIGILNIDFGNSALEAVPESFVTINDHNTNNTDANYMRKLRLCIRLRFQHFFINLRRFCVVLLFVSPSLYLFIVMFYWWYTQRLYLNLFILFLYFQMPSYVGISIEAFYFAAKLISARYHYIITSDG